MQTIEPRTVLSEDQRVARGIILTRVGELIDRLASDPLTQGFEIEIRPPHNGQLIMFVRETHSKKLAFR